MVVRVALEVDEYGDCGGCCCIELDGGYEMLFFHFSFVVFFFEFTFFTFLRTEIPILLAWHGMAMDVLRVVPGGEGVNN